MKVFISWSGRRSRIIAEALNGWLPNVIQSLETFYSPEIEKGTRGGAEINAVLEGTSFGIICLTPDNLKSEWIHYEAGALAKINDQNTRVWTLLNGLNHSDVAQPLAQFQHTLTEKEDVYRLVESINKHLDKPLSDISLRKTFEIWWSELEGSFKRAEEVGNQKNEKENQNAENIRTEREILNEILEILRGQQRVKQRNFIDTALKNIQGNYPKIRIVFGDTPTDADTAGEITSKLKRFFPHNSHFSFYPMLTDLMLEITPNGYISEEGLVYILSLMPNELKAEIKSVSIADMSGLNNFIELW